MTENIPTDPFDDELLSAYVDGELTGAQLAQVEQRLADDSQARQLVEELRALSQEVQALPRETLGEDLRTTIMQRAERAMLLGSEEEGSLRTREPGSPRRWMWAAMALAATLLLTAYLPNAEQEERPLADAKPVPEDSPRSDRSLEAAIPEEEAEREAFAADEFRDFEPEGLVRSSEALAESSSEAEPPMGLRSRAAMAPAGVAGNQPPMEELQFACEVHVTLSDTGKSVEQFHQVLFNNRIVLEDGNEQSGQKNETSQGFAARRRQSNQPPDGQPAVQEEAWVVEATREQLEDALEEFNADTSNILALDILERQPTEVPIKQLQQQYNRSGKQAVQNKLRQAKKAAGQIQQGRARRLYPDEYQRQDKGGYGGQLDRFAKDALRAKANANAHLQFLFILKAPGESTSADAAAPTDR